MSELKKVELVVQIKSPSSTICEVTVPLDHDILAADKYGWKYKGKHIHASIVKEFEAQEDKIFNSNITHARDCQHEAPELSYSSWSASSSSHLNCNEWIRADSADVVSMLCAEKRVEWTMSMCCNRIVAVVARR